MIYRLMLGIHSWNRWIVLILALALLFVAWKSWLGRSQDKSGTMKTSVLFIIALDIQLLLGIVLLFVSPIVASLFQDPGSSMSQPSLRFFGVEHVTLMLLATVMAHVGRVLLKKTADPVAANRKAAIFFTVALLLMLAGVPWPGLAWGRPLFFLG